MLKAPQRRLWWSCQHTDHLVVLRAQRSAAPPLVAQKAAAAEPSIRHRRWRLRAPSAHLGAAGAGGRQQALGAPNRPSRCVTGPVYRAASAPVRAHGCGEAAAHQPPRRRSSAVRGGSCRSARAAARPAAGLSRDSRFGGRCARCAQTCQRTEPAAAAVPTSAGRQASAYPAATGCQRSSARRCRQSTARCRRPGRRSSSPTTRHPRT